MNKRKWIALLIAIVMLLSFTIAGLAESAMVNTKSSPLTMRKTPDNGGSTVTKIPKGETVQVLERGEWALVAFDGKQGYVNGQYLLYLDDEAQPADENTAGLTDGTYVVSEPDVGIPACTMTLTMIVKDGKIKEIKAEGEGPAFQKKNVLNKNILALCSQIVEEQSVEIDVIAGVTMSGTAVLKAAQECYVQAGGILTAESEEPIGE